MGLDKEHVCRTHRPRQQCSDGGKGGHAGWAKVGVGTSVIVSTITIVKKRVALKQ